MSSPAGWYPQDDGRLRYWDGEHWTEHFHEVETAGGASESATDPAGTVEAGAAGGATESIIDTGAPTVAYPGTAGPGTATPPAHGPAPTATASTGMSGTTKGCLIAAAIGAVLLILAVIAGVLIFNRAKAEIDNLPMPTSSSDVSIPGLPTEPPLPPLPDQTPGGDATAAPDDAETGESAPFAAGESFMLRGNTFNAGWQVVQPAEGGSIIEGLTVAAPPSAAFEFDLEFWTENYDLIDVATCRVEVGQTDIACTPMTEDVSGAYEINAYIWQ